MKTKRHSLSVTAYTMAVLAPAALLLTCLGPGARRVQADVAAEAKQHYEAGLKLKQAKQFAKAAEELEAALKIEKDYTDAHWALGWVYSALGRKPEAVAEFKEVLRLVPDTPRAKEARDAIKRLGSATTKPSVPKPATGTPATVRPSAAASPKELLDEALAAAKPLQDAFSKSIALANCGLWRSMLDKEQGLKEFEEALAAVCEATPEEDRPALMAELGESVGDLAQLNEELATELIARIEKQNRPWVHSLALSHLILEVAKKDPLRAAKMLDPVKDEEQRPWRAECVSALVREVARVDKQQALDLGSSVKDAGLRDMALANAVGGLMKTNAEEAIALVNGFESAWLRAFALREVARGLAETDPSKAITTAQSIKPMRCRAEAFAAIGRQIAAKDAAGAREVLQQAVQAALSIGKSEQRNEILSAIAVAAAGFDRTSAVAILEYLSAQDWGRVREALEELDPAFALEFTRKVKSADYDLRWQTHLAAKTSATEAMALARRIADPLERSLALCEVVKVMVTPEAVKQAGPAPVKLAQAAEGAPLFSPPKTVTPSFGRWAVYGGRNDILCLAASGGSVWAGTWNGVVRWNLADGKCERFGKAEGLPGFVVPQIVADARGTAWAMTEGGLAQFNGANWSKVEGVPLRLRPAEPIPLLCMDGQGSMWVGSGGKLLRGWGGTAVGSSSLEKTSILSSPLFRYDGQKWTQFTAENLASPVSRGQRLISIVSDAKGSVWGVAAKSWWKLDGEHWQRCDEAPWGVKGGPTQDTDCVLADKRGWLWVGTSEGIWHCDGQAWRSHLPKAQQGEEGYSPNCPPSGEGFAVDSQGNVWVSSRRAIYKATADAAAPQGVRWDRVPAVEGVPLNAPIAVDAQDGLWVGSTRFAAGERKDLPVEPGPIENARVLALDPDGSPWLAAKDGLHKLGGEPVGRALPGELKPTAPRSLHTVAFDGQGKMWVSGWTGQVHEAGQRLWSSVGKGWKPCQTPACVRRFVAEKGGTLWAALHEKGQGVADEGKGIGKWDGNTFTVFTTATSGLASDEVRDLAIHPDGSVWLATTRGVSRFDGTNWQTFQEVDGSLPSDDALSVAADAKGVVWVGTSAGLAKCENNAWSVYTSSNSPMPGNSVSALSIDDTGVKWVSTDAGLCSFEGTNWKWYEWRWPMETILCGKDGIVWAGSSALPWVLRLTPEGLTEPPDPVFQAPTVEAPEVAPEVPPPPGQPRPGESLFEDDFTQGLDNWQILGGTVQIEQGELSVEGGKPPNEFPIAMLKRQFTEDRLAIEFDARSVEPSVGDISVKLSGYTVSLGGWNNARTVLFKQLPQELASVNLGVKAGQKYHCRFVRDGSKLFFYVDGELKLQAEDPDPATGAQAQQIMLITYFNKHVHFSKVRVKSLPKEE